MTSLCDHIQFIEMCKGRVHSLFYHGVAASQVCTLPLDPSSGMLDEDDLVRRLSKIQNMMLNSIERGITWNHHDMLTDV